MNVHKHTAAGAEFRLCVADPQRTQAEILTRILRQNESCEYGRRLSFARITSVLEFQKTVPVCSYEDLRHDIQRMTHGAVGVLVSQPVRRYFLTSGSSASPKHIPVTAALIREKWSAFQKFWDIVRRDFPDIAKGTVVANFTDGSREQTTPGGALCSSESSFWNAWSGRMASTTAPLPKAVLNIADPDARYYTIARLLLETNLSALMALNPSTILKLFQTIVSEHEFLKQDIRNGGLSRNIAVEPAVREYVAARFRGNPCRADQLGCIEPKGFAARELWPTLRVVICWRSPMLHPYIDMLQPYLDGLPQRDYISMASEGIIAVPYEDSVSGGALAVGTHFYEFIPEEYATDQSSPTLLPHELQRDRNYVVVLTTSAGLYRYNIGDVVQVRDFLGEVPVLEFLYRTGHTCSLTGEKLTENQVVLAMTKASERLGIPLHAVTLCPAFTPFPHYILLSEQQPELDRGHLRQFISALDVCLADTNIEYRSKRASRRLGTPELWVLPPGSYARVREHKVSAGVSDAQIKLPYLTRDASWHQQFQIIERISCESQV